MSDKELRESDFQLRRRHAILETLLSELVVRDLAQGHIMRDLQKGASKSRGWVIVALAIVVGRGAGADDLAAPSGNVQPSEHCVPLHNSESTKVGLKDDYKWYVGMLDESANRRLFELYQEALATVSIVDGQPWIPADSLPNFYLQRVPITPRALAVMKQLHALSEEFVNSQRGQ